jgi:hypothetical protein
MFFWFSFSMAPSSMQCSTLKFYASTLPTQGGQQFGFIPVTFCSIDTNCTTKHYLEIQEILSRGEPLIFMAGDIPDIREVFPRAECGRS